MEPVKYLRTRLEPPKGRKKGKKGREKKKKKTNKGDDGMIDIREVEPKKHQKM